jgi:cytochrome c oxidase subunit 2
LTKGRTAAKPANSQWLHNNQNRFAIFFLVVFLGAVIGATVYYSKNFLPYPAAVPATHVIPLFVTISIATGITFLVTQILLFYFLFRNKTTAARNAKFQVGSFKLELTWSVLTTVFFIFLFVWGEMLWLKIVDKAPDDALTIEVVGQQFNWKVRYGGQDQKLGRASFRFVGADNDSGVDPSDPDGKDDFIPVQMHVPKTRPIHLILRSNDVIHSFYIPYFRSKMDAVPGMITGINFTPILSTQEMRVKRNDPEFNYEIACAELCGRMHFAMKLILVVDEPRDFDAWYRLQKPFDVGTGPK